MALPKTLLTLLLLLAVPPGEQIRFPGECPKPPVMANLQVRDYLVGTWYDFKKYSIFSETDFLFRCSSVTYGYSDDGTIEFEELEVWNNDIYGANGTLELFKGSGHNHTVASFIRSYLDNEVPRDRPNYNLLHADNNYSIEWDCRTFNETDDNGTVILINRQPLIIRTRVRSPTKSVRRSIRRKLKSLFPGFDKTNLKKISQKNCPSP